MSLHFFLLLAVSPHLTVDSTGPINAVTVEQAGHRLAIYRAKSGAEQLLLTHHRRDVIGNPPPAGIAITAPADERQFIEGAPDFWKRHTTERFHDYAARASKVPVAAIPVSRWVSDASTFDFHGLPIRVLSTPGYTVGAVSYAASIDGKNVIFSGDLIYGDGQLIDIYSLQTAIPETKTRGYHGYAARAAQLIASLRRIRAEKPDLLVPARGPVITNPPASIDKLIGRLESLFHEHFSTDALRWYWGDDHLRQRASGILGRDAAIDWMPMSEQSKLPAWIIPIQNSRLIISTSGAAYLVDCGNARILAEVKRLQSEGRFKTLEGIFVTHYHDDHSDFAEQAAREFNTTVEYSPIQSDILAHPHSFRMPCLTMNPITRAQVRPDGFKRRWHEFNFTFHDFPGQTLYHSALLIERESGERIYFIGDSFTPSGLDDYCLQNRDLLNADQGYRRCLRQLRNLDTTSLWLINQHVEPMFRYSAANLDRMESSLTRRHAILRELIALPDPNYGVDESWAAFYPYAADVRPGAPIDLTVRITHHTKDKIRITPRVPAGWKADVLKDGFTIRVTPPASAPAGLHIITADVAVGPWRFEQFTEAMLTVNK